MTQTVDMTWAAFDQARGTKPRQKAAAPPPDDPNLNPVIALSPGAKAAVMAIQKEAGLPQTGQLDPATIGYAKAHYVTPGQQIVNTAKAAATAAAKKAAAAKTAAAKKAAAATKKAAAQKTAAAKKVAAAKKKAAAQKTAAANKAASAKATAQRKAAAATKKTASQNAAAAKAAAKATAAAQKAAAAKTTAAQKAATKSAAAKPAVSTTPSGATVNSVKVTKTSSLSETKTMIEALEADLSFGGKKAAPFVKGGGRSTAHPNDAKGHARQVLKAKAKAKAARTRKLPATSGVVTQMANTRLVGDTDLAITPGGHVGDASSLAKPGYKGKRKLSDYEREVAHALMRKRGIPKERAIPMARGIINRAAEKGQWGGKRGKRGKASPAVRAGAAASEAQRASFSNEVDLALGAKWHHGWIPANAEAEAEKLKEGDTVRDRLFQGAEHRHDHTRTGTVVAISKDTYMNEKKNAQVKVKWEDGTVSHHESQLLEKRVSKKKASLSNETDLAGKWKHGWVPEDAEAMREKAHRKASAQRGGSLIKGELPLKSTFERKTRSDAGQKRKPGAPKVKKLPKGVKGSLPLKSGYDRAPRGSKSVAGVKMTSALNSNLSNDDTDLTMVNGESAVMYSVHSGAKWHHGWIPANAQAVLEKEHKEKGGAGKVSLAHAKVYHAARVKKAMTQKDLRAHAAAHTAAAKRARTPESKAKHNKEAASALAELQRRKTESSVQRDVSAKVKAAQAHKAEIGSIDNRQPLIDDAEKRDEEKAAEATPVKNTKLSKMDPKDLTAKIKAVEALPNSGARTRQLNALNAEKARRIAAVKALSRQAREAAKFVDSAWPDGKEPLSVHNAFLKKLIAIFPSIRPKLKVLRKPDGTVRGRDTFLTVIDETVRQLARTLAGPIIGSGLGLVGLHFLVARGGG